MKNNRRDFLKTVGTVGATGIAAFIPGNRMTFAGIGDKAQRDDLVAYLTIASKTN